MDIYRALYVKYSESTITFLDLIIIVEVDVAVEKVG